MAASAATARIVVRSKPSAANRRLAAARIAARECSDRGEKVMPTSVGQRLLTELVEPATFWQQALANNRWHKEQDMSELPRRTDVLIIGAGPVGLTLAAALMARGVDVVL